MMKRFTKTILKEMAAVLGSRSGLLLLLAAPVLFMGGVGTAYWNKRVPDVPVCVINRDNSPLSREIIQAIDASKNFAVAESFQSVEDAQKQMDAGKLKACFVFPENFSKDVKRGKPTKVLVLLDATNIVVANVVSTNASVILGSYSIGTDMRKVLAKGQVPRESVSNVAMPVQDSYRIAYNPAFNDNYANFMIIGMAMVAIQLVAFLLAAGSMSAGKMQARAIPAKCAAYTLLVCVPAMLTVLIPVMAMQIPVLGSVGLLLVIVCWYAAILCIFGIGVAALSGDALQATEYLAIIAMPAFLLSGYTWPDYAMPGYLATVAHSLPLTAPALIARKISLNAAGTAQLQPEIRTMLVWTVFAVLVAALGALITARRERNAGESGK